MKVNRIEHGHWKERDGKRQRRRKREIGRQKDVYIRVNKCSKKQITIIYVDNQFQSKSNNSYFEQLLREVDERDTGKKIL